MKYLITGAAGFIGFHTSRTLLERGETVIGVDIINDYYDPGIKEARLDILRNTSEKFSFFKTDMTDREGIEKIFADQEPTCVINLAAQAGVRYSVENPHAYLDSNLIGFINVLECCRQFQVKHFVFASSSSVYGANTLMPFSEKIGTGHQMSLYAATKRANEVIAHSYAHLFDLPCTGLRFFTVYGPWGRPDMALFKFTKAILAGTPIDVYNKGQMMRDFTYIDDIVEGVVRLCEHLPKPNPDIDMGTTLPDPGSSPIAPFRIYNIGCGQEVPLMTYIQTLEKKLNRKADYNMLPMQAGDVSATIADVSALEQEIGYRPTTGIDEGISNFVDWYREYYNIG